MNMYATLLLCRKHVSYNACVQETCFLHVQESFLQNVIACELLFSRIIFFTRNVQEICFLQKCHLRNMFLASLNTTVYIYIYVQEIIFLQNTGKFPTRVKIWCRKFPAHAYTVIIWCRKHYSCTSTSKINTGAPSLWFSFLFEHGLHGHINFLDSLVHLSS